MSNVNNLARTGLTNHGTEDYGTLASSKRRELIAQCTSNHCTQTTKLSKVKNKATKEYELKQMIAYRPYAIKNVSRRQDTCPDCGYGLFWKWVKGDVIFDHVVTGPNVNRDERKY